MGLKENVIIGKLIPAGSGLAAYRKYDKIEDECCCCDHDHSHDQDAEGREADAEDMGAAEDEILSIEMEETSDPAEI